MSHLLQPHPTFEQQHQAGVALLKSNPDQAAEVLDNALWSVTGFYLDREPAAKIHTGRILRDLGNASLRRAIRALPRSEQQADNLLSQSVDYLTGSADILQQVAEPDPAYTDEAQQYAIAQHGATVSLQAREQTVELIARDKKEAGDAATALFQQAFPLLLRGGNGYFRTSNDMNAARLERFQGHEIAAAKWALRGGMALNYALTSDRRNASPSMNTFGRLSKDIVRGKTAIRQSVLSGEV